MSVLSNLIALLSLDNSAYLQGLEASQGATGSFVSGLSNVGGAVVMGGLTAAAAAVSAVGAAAWDAGNTVDGAMDVIQIGTGASGEALQGLRKDFEETFTAVPTDANTAASVISELNTRLGVTGEALTDVSVPLLDMTRMLGGDATQNAQLFSRVIGDWNIPMDESAGLLDKLFVASQNTGIGVDSLMTKVVQFGSPMRLMGFSLDESISLFGKWEKEGVNAELVMGSLRIAAGKFAREGVDLQKGLWDTVEAIKGASSESEALALAMDVFGARAGPDMAAAILEGRFEIDDLVQSLSTADGAISRASDATADWGEQWTKFKNRITVALAPIGEGMMSAAGDALEQVVGIFERPEVQSGITTFATMAVQGISQVVMHIPTLINGLLAFVTFLQNNQAIVVGVLGALGVAALAWGVTTAAAAWTAMAPLLPIIAVLAAIAAVAALVYLAWTNNWGGIQDKMQAVWAFLQPIFSQVVTWFRQNIPVAIQYLSNLWTTTLLPAIQAVWSWMQSTLFPFLQSLGEFLGAVLGKAVEALAGLWQNVLQPALAGVWQFIKDNVWPLLQEFGAWLSDKLGPAFDGISKAIQGATKWLSDMAEEIANLKLPDWLTPGSPTPWEIGLWGIGDALRDLSRTQLPDFNAELQLQPVGVGLEPTTAGASGAARASAPLVVHVQYAPTISTASEYEAQHVLGPFIETYLRNREKKS